jgi:hypothetical protein
MSPRIIFKKLALLFSAGALGGLANSIAVWLFGLLGIGALFGVAIAPALTPAWLYPRLVWGGLWGVVFLFLELKKRDFYLCALIGSIFPSLVMCLIVFPFKLGKGYLGLELGALTPVMVVLFNYIWAVVTLFVYRRIRD